MVEQLQVRSSDRGPVIRTRNPRMLSRKALEERAHNVRLVVTDNDGVLTDTGVYYSDEGECLKRYSIRDGMGVELLRKAGIETCIVTGEASPSLLRRAEKLRIGKVYTSARDKRATLDDILTSTGFSPRNIAFIGDDINDIPLLEAVLSDGLTGCPADGVALVKHAVHFQTLARGGNGAFREFADWILYLRASSPHTHDKEGAVNGDHR